MDFVKNHLFLIVLGAVTLVVMGVVMAGFYLPTSADAKASIAEKETLANDVSRYASTGLNEQMLANKQVYVNKVTTEFNSLLDLAYTANQKGRESFTVQKQVVFAPGQQTYKTDQRIPWNYEAEYRAKMTELLASLSPTLPPTPEKVAEEAEFMSRLMAQEKAPASTGPLTPFPPGVDVPMEVTPGADGSTDMGPGYPSYPVQPGPTEDSYVVSPEVDQVEATRRAKDNLMIQHASEGPIYASEQSLAIYPLPRGRPSTPVDMWKAQVYYWLQKDLVEAIRQTNQQVLQSRTPPGQTPPQATVLNTPIKRLVQVVMEGTDPTLGYYFGGLAGGSAGMSSSYMPTETGGAAAQATLTGRACSDKHDVVNYSVTLVMTQADLNTFMQSLLSRNFYTVLNVKLENVDATITPSDSSYTSAMTMMMPTGTPSTSTASAIPEDHYYYGPDPVVRATFQIEAMLFTKWVRPMMPVEMLQLLPPSALRAEDTERVNASRSTTPIY